MEEKQGLANIKVMKNAIYKLDGVKSSFSEGKNLPEPRETTVIASTNEEDQKGITIAEWGNDNKFPNKLLAQTSKSGVAKRALNFQIKSHYGAGLLIYSEEFEDGRRIINPVTPDSEEYSKIFEFVRNSRVNRYLKEIISDAEYFYWPVSELIFNDGGTEILEINHLETQFCRLSVMDSESRRIEYLVYSGEFTDINNNTPIIGKNADLIPLLEPSWSREEITKFVRELPKGKKKVIYPCQFPTPGRTYYPDADWHSIYQNGWLEVSEMVPSIKKAIFENQLSIKYKVSVDVKFWKYWYNGEGENETAWDEMTREQKEKAVEDYLETFDDKLSGNENAGKSIHLPRLNNEDLITIEAIDEKLKDGEYIPDSQAANSEILFAIGVDPSMIGHGFPGGKMGAGSGSDKREAFQIHTALKSYEREITLEALNYVAWFNQWPANLKFGYKDIELTTLDNNPTGRQQVVTS